MSSVVISPDGTSVYTAGTTGSAYETVALSAADGSERWERTWDPFSGRWADARAIATSPDGSKVFVTGVIGLAVHGSTYGTVAYGTAAGTELWTATYGTSMIFLGSDARALAVNSDGVEGLRHRRSLESVHPRLRLRNRRLSDLTHRHAEPAPH